MQKYPLRRFLDVQAYTYQNALNEIKNGRKESHWMWYIFPQLRGLGRSSAAYTYGLDGLNEAKAYLAHPVLSARLIQITEAVLLHKDKHIVDIMGETDAMKLRSSMTLFALLSEENSVFHQVLDCFYGSKMDGLTLKLIGI